jgi:hypothetical protein
VIVGSDAAREKVSHFFRHLRSKTSSSTLSTTDDDVEQSSVSPQQAVPTDVAQRKKPPPKRVTPVESTLLSYQAAFKKTFPSDTTET